MRSNDDHCRLPASVITALSPAQATAASALLTSVADWANRHDPGFWDACDLRPERMDRQSRLGALFGYISDEVLLACMLLQPEDHVHWPDAKPGEALYLHKLAVDRAAAGRQLGEAMVDFAVHTARQRGVARLRLDTVPEGPLPSYYGRQGFVADPQAPGHYAGRRLIRMEKLVSDVRS